MVIYSSGFLTLDYDPGTDILSVSLPPVEEILIPEISGSFGIIVEHARNYDIKRLLFNAKDTRVDVPEEEFVPIISAFARSLSTTRVRKIARVSSPSFIREHLVEKMFVAGEMTIQFRSFPEMSPAIAWLVR